MIDTITDTIRAGYWCGWEPGEQTVDALAEICAPEPPPLASVYRTDPWHKSRRSRAAAAIAEQEARRVAADIRARWMDPDRGYGLRAVDGARKEMRRIAERAIDGALVGVA